MLLYGYPKLPADGIIYARKIINVIKNEIDYAKGVQEEDLLWRLQPPATREKIRFAIHLLYGSNTPEQRHWDNRGRVAQDQQINEIVSEVERTTDIIIEAEEAEEAEEGEEGEDVKVELTPYGEYYARKVLGIIKGEVQVDPDVNAEDILWRLQPRLLTHETIRSVIFILKGEDTHDARQWAVNDREQDETIDEILLQVEQRSNYWSID